MQTEVDKWINNHKSSYWKPHEILARISEENGELAREINHKYGPKKKKDNESEGRISEELGDILFSIICMANSEGISLDKSFGEAMEKCYGRDDKRFEKL